MNIQKITVAGMKKQNANREIASVTAKMETKHFVTYTNTTAGSAAERMTTKAEAGYKLTWIVEWK